MLLVIGGFGENVVVTGGAMVGAGGSTRGTAVLGAALVAGLGVEAGAVVRVLGVVRRADVVGCCATVARTFSSAGALGAVGLVWFGLCVDGRSEAASARFPAVGREAVRAFAAHRALDLLRRRLPGA